jgi:hypothetical protein
VVRCAARSASSRRPRRLAGPNVLVERDSEFDVQAECAGWHGTGWCRWASAIRCAGGVLRSAKLVGLEPRSWLVRERCMAERVAVAVMLGELGRVANATPDDEPLDDGLM